MYKSILSVWALTSLNFFDYFSLKATDYILKENNSKSPATFKDEKEALGTRMLEEGIKFNAFVVLR